jgi:hypothetical protein
VSAWRWPVWRQFPPEVRALARWFTLVQVVGYATALAYVWQTTRLLPGGIADHYRGSDTTEGAMQFPKSLSEMLTLTHTHLLSMAAIFLASGLALSFCERVTRRWKRWLMVEPFIALLVSFSAMWLMRYVHPGFSLLLAISSSLMALTFFGQSVLVWRELGPRDDPKGEAAR